MRKTRLIAFYLPQYHPIPENDEWWGKGFTEWINVVRGRPRFKGHYQPRLPSELGFYDLRVPEVREAQAALAKAYGISAFCYYHYWFQGKRLLNRVFDEVLESGSPDMDFCLCWANEPWRRNWDGVSGDILVDQAYSRDDDLAHIHWLARAFSDRRYIRVAGKPLFVVYRAQDLPDARRTTDTWREEAHRLGIGDLYLCCAETTGFSSDLLELGFDAAVEFAPHQYTALEQLPSVSNGYSRLFDYSDVATSYQAKYARGYVRHPCVVPGWDNSARRRLITAYVLHGSTPDRYESWLRAAIAYAAEKPAAEQLVFVNAWNEWAEGAYLEPDQRYGRQYLEATKRALEPMISGENHPLVGTDQQGMNTSVPGVAQPDGEASESDDLNEALARAANQAALWEQRFLELETYTRQLMTEQKSIRVLSRRLLKEIASRLFPRIFRR